jgi:hypothetical protein
VLMTVDTTVKRFQRLGLVGKGKVKISLLQAVEAHRVARG